MSDQFGGGMIPFDNAYHDALRAGASVAEAQLAGVAEVRAEERAATLPLVEALEQIDRETRHISGNAGRLGQIARDALEAHFNQEANKTT